MWNKDKDRIRNSIKNRNVYGYYVRIRIKKKIKKNKKIKNKESCHINSLRNGNV